MECCEVDRAGEKCDVQNQKKENLGVWPKGRKEWRAVAIRLGF